MMLAVLIERPLRMDNNDFSNLGEQIMDSVQEAIDSMNFNQLNRQISDTVNTAIGEAKDQLLKGMGSVGRPASDAAHQADKKAAAIPEKKADIAVLSHKKPGRVASILYTVFGGIGLGLVLLLFLAVWMFGLLVRPLWGVLLGFSILLLILGIVFGVMLGTGISMRERFKRAGMYLKQAGSRHYIEIGELAAGIGRSKKFVIKDLQRMMAKGILAGAYLDEQKTCLMLNQETYQQYLSAQKAHVLREKEMKKEAFAAGRKAKAPVPKPEPLPEGLREMMARGRSQLQIIKEANDAIAGEVISRKISRLEHVIQRIFESVELHPEQMEEMGRFMEYYLPTSVKLVTAYRDFDRIEVEGENVVSAKHEIEETLDTINAAFERLLDDLYQDAAIDISTDASVLQTMLKKDGFAEQDFNRRTDR